MNYYEMREMFLDILNRTDVTPEDADKFIYLGVTRIDRRLRTILQKRVETLTLRTSGDFQIPYDMLTVDRIEDAHGVIPRVGTVRPNERGYRITPTGISVGHSVEQITLTYYSEFDKSIPDVDSGTIPRHAGVIPDVVVYGALIYAADKFEDSRAERFENTFERLLAEVQLMSDEVELGGHPVISNPYEGYV